MAMLLESPRKTQIYVPDGATPEAALARTRVMCIGAHADDLEILSFWLILRALGFWNYFGVVVTNGAGSPRQGRYRDFTDDEIVALRKSEQFESADIGKFSGVAMLGHSSSSLDGPDRETVVSELAELIEAAQPEILVIHNFFDRHRTHRSCMWRAVEAIHRVRPDARPTELLGGEVWGPINHLPAHRIRNFDASDPDGLLPRLLRAFRSQTVGGKRYDEAVPAGFLHNRTFAQSHEVDGNEQALMHCLDLTPLIDPQVDRREFLRDIMCEWHNDTLEGNDDVL